MTSVLSIGISVHHHQHPHHVAQKAPCNCSVLECVKKIHPECVSTARWMSLLVPSREFVKPAVHFRTIYEIYGEHLRNFMSL